MRHVRRTEQNARLRMSSTAIAEQIAVGDGHRLVKGVHDLRSRRVGRKGTWWAPERAHACASKHCAHGATACARGEGCRKMERMEKRWRPAENHAPIAAGLGEWDGPVGVVATSEVAAHAVLQRVGCVYVTWRGRVRQARMQKRPRGGCIFV